MATANVSLLANGHRFIQITGEAKMEVIHFTMDSIGASDTSLTSNLAHPIVCWAEFSGDQGDAAVDGGLVVDNDESSATFKQITLTDFDDIALDLGVTISVIGY